MAGKFANEADEYVYGLSLDGCDAEAGDVQFAGWAGMTRFHYDEGTEVYYAAARDALAGRGGGLDRAPHSAIIREDGHGFVAVDYHYDEATLLAAWDAVLAEVEPNDEED